MIHAFDIFRDYNMIGIIFRIIIAFAVGTSLGLERDRKRRSAGLRTHVLVCLGGMLTELTGMYISGYMGYFMAGTRLSATVISGISFLGAGVIIVEYRRHIRGLTTAAGLWITAIIGIAAGAGLYEAVLFFTIFVEVAIGVLRNFAFRLNQRRDTVHLYVELDSAWEVNEFLAATKQEYRGIRDLRVVPSCSGKDNYVGLEFNLIYGKGEYKTKEIIKKVQKFPNVAFVIKTY
ncbi:MAG: MgtC/SapB family protein [Lachnospiraceae bacterium]|nr:MgtC/SapB family protein [Lachnospiraceae bacterium]